jgi:hypothetical protein
VTKRTRDDGPVGARHVGDAGHHDIKIRVYVRSPMGKPLPSQRQVENKISDLLLAMPRLDDDPQPDWDVSATSIPPEKEREDAH